MKKLTIRNEDVKEAVLVKDETTKVVITHANLVFVEGNKETAMFLRNREDGSLSLNNPAMGLTEVEKKFQFANPIFIRDARPIGDEPFITCVTDRLGKRSIVYGGFAIKENMEDEDCHQVAVTTDQLDNLSILSILSGEISYGEPVHIQCEPAENGECHYVQLDSNGKAHISRCRKPNRHPVESLLEHLSEVMNRAK